MPVPDIAIRGEQKGHRKGWRGGESARGGETAARGGGRRVGSLCAVRWRDVAIYRRLEGVPVNEVGVQI